MRILVILLLFLLHTDAAIAASSLLKAVESGSTDAFSNIPAYRIRFYVGSLLENIARACPELKADPAILGAATSAVAYMNKSALTTGRAPGPDVSAAAVALSLEDQAFMSRSNPTDDGAAWAKSHQCSALKFSALKRNAERIFRAAEIAGPLEKQAMQSCEATFKNGLGCACLASAVDMQTTPRQRASLTKQKEWSASLKELLNTADFVAPASLRCKPLPNLQYALEDNQFRNFEIFDLATLMIRWRTDARIAGIDPRRRPEMQAGILYVGQHPKGRNALRVLVCRYGAPTAASGTSSALDRDSYLYWYERQGMSRAEIRENLADYPLVDRLLALDETPLTACPSSRPSRTATTVAASAAPASSAPVTPPAAPGSSMQSAGDAVPQATTQERNCERLQRQLSRALANPGRSTERQVQTITKLLADRNCR